MPYRVARRHDRRGSAIVVHATKPSAEMVQLPPVLCGDLRMLSNLHRPPTPRARITIAGYDQVRALLVALLVLAHVTRPHAEVVPLLSRLCAQLQRTGLGALALVVHSSFWHSVFLQSLIWSPFLVSVQ